ncbi:iron uptake transporter deferrochelatase/peroxidase subunit [Kushneria phyllosphaerae]|uniref:Deferrochelatase n=1 Tax=Kushneria phyllosphaerae TaxID=2100822 RepID=A0A2R8CGS0_9GAMM|nr:iron uptake transporter deferrochelatase/peroxidase subunit [Kushneria phyllosphaerae]SPJ32063.1 Deferrochelatase/peroxidase EfeB [Kushneria phyllosphaerae]
MTDDQHPTRCPFILTDDTALDRRRFLRGAGMTGLGLGLSGLCPGQALARLPHEQAPHRQEMTSAPLEQSEQLAYPFYGRHQQGVVTPRQATGMVVSFDILAMDRDALETLLRTLTARIAFLTRGGSYPEHDPRFPPPDSGTLGPHIAPDGLTMTVAVGTSLFDERFGLASQRPTHLQRMQKFPNDALDAPRCHGDLAIQICANTIDTVYHALRDIIKNTPGGLLVRWKQTGTVPLLPPSPGDLNGSARNFLGFRDGSANPAAEDQPLMNALVWIDGQRDEPPWTHGGSYMAVRIIRNLVERWDRTPLGEQEAIFGRRKMSGAPLSGGQEQDVPDYAADPEGHVTPLDAHIRLANPRTPATEKHRILRRPFNYANGVETNGQLDMGLLFICFQADLAAGFIAVQQRLDGEPLEEYIKPVGGGYFFVLPGVTDDSDFLGRSLLAATA